MIHGKQARKILIDNFKKFADIVTSTLGPFGRNVIIYKSNGMHHSTKDGVTVANDILSKDRMEQISFDLGREVANLTREQVGDGTTTATCIAAAILEGYQEVEENIKNVHDFRKDMIALSEKVIAKMEEISVTDVTEKDIFSQAMISSNGHEQISNMVADCYKKIGKDGIVQVHHNFDDAITYEIINGYKMKAGFYSYEFVNDPVKHECKFSNPLIFATDFNIKDGNSLSAIAAVGIKYDKPIVIVCRGISETAIGYLTQLKKQSNNTSKICVIRAPHEAIHQKNQIENIALLSGGIFHSEAKGDSLLSIRPEHFGKAKEFLATKYYSEFLEMTPSADLENKKSSLMLDLKEAKNQIEKNQLEARISDLSGMAAIIWVGAISSLEGKELKDKVDDTVAGVKSLFKKGFLPGSGWGYLWAEGLVLGPQKIAPYEMVIKNALFSVFTQILINRYGEIPSEIMEKNPFKTPHFNKIWSVVDGDFVSFREAGIIDSTDMLVCALRNAISVASTVILTEYIIEGYGQDTLFE